MPAWREPCSGAKAPSPPFHAWFPAYLLYLPPLRFYDDNTCRL
ncbi:hypothetical protein MTATph1_CDS0216 [Moorella phage MTATph1]